MLTLCRIVYLGVGLLEKHTGCGSVQLVPMTTSAKHRNLRFLVGALRLYILVFILFS